MQRLGWISEEEKARWMAGCFAALSLPSQAESFGSVTLEAAHCHKTVITFQDPGGTVELLEHGWDGLGVPPTAESLPEAMERLWADRGTAQRMGREAGRIPARHHIHWDHVIERLTAA